IGIGAERGGGRGRRWGWWRRRRRGLFLLTCAQGQHCGQGHHEGAILHPALLHLFILHASSFSRMPFAPQDAQQRRVLGAPAITTYWGAKPVRVRFLLCFPTAVAERTARPR